MELRLLRLGPSLMDVGSLPSMLSCTASSTELRRELTAMAESYSMLEYWLSAS